MKFVVDENLGSSISKWLRQQGHDVKCIGADYPGMNDRIVLKKAYEESRILITNDKDFGELVFKYQQPHCGIIFLRINYIDFDKILHFLTNILKHHQDDLQDNFVVASDNSIRIVRSISH